MQGGEEGGQDRRPVHPAPSDGGRPAPGPQGPSRAARIAARPTPRPVMAPGPRQVPIATRPTRGIPTDWPAFTGISTTPTQTPTVSELRGGPMSRGAKEPTLRPPGRTREPHPLPSPPSDPGARAADGRKSPARSGGEGAGRLARSGAMRRPVVLAPSAPGAGQGRSGDNRDTRDGDPPMSV